MPSKSIRWLLLGVAIIFLSQLTIQITSNKTLVVFCDVGQGDGAYLRLYGKYDIVIDAGPNDKILECLGKYMPFYDKTIELAFLSHPQNDHFGGFSSILNFYHVNKFITTETVVKNSKYEALINELKNIKTTITYLYEGDKIKIADTNFTFLSPPKRLFLQNKSLSDLNEVSQIILMTNSFTSVLFTGDATPNTLKNIVKKYRFNSEILKVPHHGSRNGLIEELLNLANPAIAVISVGKHNSYGHPSQEILNMLTKHQTNIRRTDRDGSIIFKY